MHQHAQEAIARSDFAQAEAWFRLLHKAKPTDAYFLASLGQSLCWQNRLKEGKDYLVRSAKLLERQAAKTRNFRLTQELSAQLLHWGEVKTAERLARLALSLTPDSASALNNLVMCLTRVNRNEEALPLSRQVCEMLPEHPGCHILLALIEAKTGSIDQALQRLQKVIKRNLEAEQTARAHLEMGVILDNLGRYEEAFAALTTAAEGNSARLNQHPANRDELFTTLARNSENFTIPLLQRWSVRQLCSDRLPVPAFLMGFLRSGTTLTEQVLAAHPQLITTDESSIVHELTRELQKLTGIDNDSALALNALKEADLRQLRQFYWRRMREEYGPQVMLKQVVDKNALNTIDLGVISVVFPEAKIIFALRDPRDICISCFMQAFSPAPATVNLLSWEGIARQYSAVMGYWLTLRDNIQPTFLELRYEDTVANFEATYRQVFDFLGVVWHPEVTQFHELAKGRYISTPSFAAVSEPIYTKAVARWKPYEKQFAPIIEELEPFIKAFGYSDQDGTYNNVA
jgi:tetratricopeptide (TPR) repeat protein